MSTLAFRLSPSSSKFSPRLGLLTLTRAPTDADGQSTHIEIATPGLIACTTRGVIQHLSRDNVRRTPCVRWVHVPFESFLQIDPPIPTLQKGMNPLHTFLGFSPSQNILSMSLRDPADVQEMPPNGKSFVVARSSRGARQVTCPLYSSYVNAIMPDIVFPLSDVPATAPPHSQRRTSKSIERSAQWLMSLLKPPDASPDAAHVKPRLNVFLQMVGGTNLAARSAFAAALREPLEGKDKLSLAPLVTLDEGVSGYVFDLAPLRSALLAELTEPDDSKHPAALTDRLSSLIHASLDTLPSTKPRLVTSPYSPHEILEFIRHGADMFDTAWAQQAASWGVALDFCFPAPHTHATGPRDLGHNLYDEQYAHDFARLAEDAAASCDCAACSPTWTNAPLVHSAADEPGTLSTQPANPYTRAYLHHLLHTHEMSAHALLVMHNITIMDAFMRGVRGVLQHKPEKFTEYISNFGQVYDKTLMITEEAKKSWWDVDQARGKGRLARERARRTAEESGVSLEDGTPVTAEQLEG